MANNPKKLTDPTDETLTAIQQVLSVSDEPTDGRAEASVDQETLPPHQYEEPVHHYEPTRPYEAPRRNAYGSDPAPERDLFEDSAPAHDDVRPSQYAGREEHQSIAQILNTLQQRPAKTSYVVATLFALAWAGCGVALAFLYMPDLQSVLKQGQAGVPAMVGLAGFVLAPIIFFYVMAYLMWRSQEMRLIAQSMAAVALKLSEPEEIARDSVVTVGQAIRREVAAMGDGVERALARAAELEALVANEVSALERAYNDNEVRIRGLLETLAHQRDTLVGQAEQVRNAITGVHLDLSHDISSVSEHVASKVNDSADRITQALTEKGEHITLALGRAGDSMIGALGERGGDLLERLERASQETAHAIAGASDRLTASLNFKTDHITEEFAEMTTNLAQMMDGRLDEVTQGFAQKSLAIVQLMDDRSAQITEGLVDSSSRLAETIATTEGYAAKNDISFGGGGGAGFFGGGFGAIGGGYDNTDIGRIVTLSFIDAYNKLVDQLGGVQSGSAGTAEATPTRGFIATVPGAMHRTPSAQGAVIRVLPAGSTVYPTGNKQGLWWEVSDENDNVGWMLNTKLAPAK